MKKRLNWPALAARWSALPENERRRVPMVLGILLLASTLLLHGVVNLPARTKAEQTLSRMTGRALKAKAGPKVAVPRWTGRSPAALGIEVAGLKEELQTQKAKLALLEPRFAALSEIGPTRELVDALTRLAEASDMELTLLEQKGLKREEKGQPPSVERLAQLASQSPYKRPLVRLTARASYRGLMGFLEGLAELPHETAPVWVSVEVKTDASGGQRPRLQWLEVTMDLNL